MARRPEVIAVLGRAVRTPRGTAGLVIAGLVVLVAVIGPAVAPYSTTEFVTAPFARASSAAWLGGDVLGRDVLSRTLNGGWQLLAMAAVATALGVVAGALLGVMAAYYGGLGQRDHARRGRDPGLPAAGVRPAAGQHPRPEDLADRAGRGHLPRAAGGPGDPLGGAGHQ